MFFCYDICSEHHCHRRSQELLLLGGCSDEEGRALTSAAAEAILGSLATAMGSLSLEQLMNCLKLMALTGQQEGDRGDFMIVWGEKDMLDDGSFFLRGEELLLLKHLKRISRCFETTKLDMEIRNKRGFKIRATGILNTASRHF